MRVVLSVLLLTAMGLAGCADYHELDGLMAPHDEGSDGNATATPEVVEMHVSSDSEPVFPVVSVATADFTAPVAVEIDRYEGDAAVLSLVADHNGLRCTSVPHADPLASPAGYKAVSSWAKCSLSANGTVFTSGAGDSMAADIPLMQGIPVDAFSWNMTVGRILVNNTGEHEQVMETIDRAQTAAPEVSTRHRMDPHRVMWSYSVCDTWFEDGLATIHLQAMAHNGRARLAVDVSDYDVWEIESSGVPIDAANATAAQDGAVWWEENGTLTAMGVWAHESLAWFDITIRFDGQGNDVYLLPSPDCPGALFVDQQDVPYQARAIGIAAGWQDMVDGGVYVEVHHSP